MPDEWPAALVRAFHSIPDPVARHRGEVRAVMPWMSSYPSYAELSNFMYPHASKYNLTALSDHLFELGILIKGPVWELDIDEEAVKFYDETITLEDRNPFNTSGLNRIDPYNREG